MIDLDWYMRFLSIILLVGAPLWGEVQFNGEVRPILSDRCYVCHGPDPGNRKKA